MHASLPRPCSRRLRPSALSAAPGLADAMHHDFIEQAARASNQQQRDQSAEDDHAVAREYSNGFQETDIDQDAQQRTERGAEPSDQAVGEAVHAEHDVEN